jgi:hypothetical protein
MFLGSAWVGDGPDAVIVSRPGLGDVVALNVVDMAVTRTGGQRIEAVRLSGGVVARDWKSGRLLLASN